MGIPQPLRGRDDLERHVTRRGLRALRLWTGDLLWCAVMTSVTHRRYISQSRFDALDCSRLERVGPYLHRSYDLMTAEWTEWITVSDDDPRAETVEHVKCGHGR